jgi:hypothetical protein
MVEQAVSIDHKNCMIAYRQSPRDIAKAIAAGSMISASVA